MSPSQPPTPPLLPRGPRQPPADGLELSCSTEPGGPNVAVVLLNTSAEGVGLLVSEPLSKGAEVFLTYHQPGRPETTQPAMVRWCRRVYGGYCRVGIRFLRPQPPAPAPPVAEPAAREPDGDRSGSDRRGAGRREAKGSARVVCRPGAVETAGDVALTLIDVCDSGARLLVNRRLEPGDEVGVVFQVRGNGNSVARKATVRWCVRTDSWAYCVGVELNEPMSEYDLRLLA